MDRQTIGFPSSRRLAIIVGAALLPLLSTTPPWSKNWLLVEKGELQPAGSGWRGVLPFRDPRIQRLAQQMRPQRARALVPLPDISSLWCGVIDCGACDNASLRWLWPDDPECGEDRSDARETRNRRRHARKPQPVAAEINLWQLDLAGAGARPRVDLLLASPRPRVLERLLPQVAQLGVGSVVVCGAAKVDPQYFQSRVLEPGSLRHSLANGLGQIRRTMMPRVFVADCDCSSQGFEEFLTPGGALDEWLGQESGAMDDGVKATRGKPAVLRLAAHPLHAEGGAALHFHELAEMAPPQTPFQRILLAVGPEAGWAEPQELDVLSAAGFQCVSLGSRILKTDVAVGALLTLAGDLLHRWNSSGLHASV